MAEKDISDKYDDLIKEFIDQRDAVKLMIKDLEGIKTKINTLLPDSMDKRFIRFFEEKVKTMTELFRVILDMRKEIIKNTKDEIELRKRFLSGNDDDFDIEAVFNIKKIAERVEKLRKEKIGIEQKNDNLIELPNTEILTNELKIQEGEKNER